MGIDLCVYWEIESVFVCVYMRVYMRGCVCSSRFAKKSESLLIMDWLSIMA